MIYDVMCVIGGGRMVMEYFVDPRWRSQAATRVMRESRVPVTFFRDRSGHHLSFPFNPYLMIFSRRSDDRLFYS